MPGRVYFWGGGWNMANSVEIQPIGNGVELSTFDVYTTSYFLSAAQTTDEHKEVKPDEL